MGSTPSLTARRLGPGVLAALLAVFFLGAGVPKILGLDTPGGANAADFERWGYPAWFRTIVGLGETAGALMLLLRRPGILGAAPRFWAAALLAVDMAGAAGTHALHGEAAMLGLPLVLLALLATLAWAERPAASAGARATAAAPAGGAPR